jgi:hypothetical protein
MFIVIEKIKAEIFALDYEDISMNHSSSTEKKQIEIFHQMPPRTSMAINHY